jgi:hypothetical protein
MKDRAASDISAAEFNVDGPRSVDIATFTGPLVMILVGLMTSVGIAIAEIIYYRKLGQVVTDTLHFTVCFFYMYYSSTNGRQMASRQSATDDRSHFQ